ncbi:winged helix-turn-helix transcriptional regulator [Bradyrhizobium sp. USDA 4454]
MERNDKANKLCSVARAMEVVGDRWSILLLREAYYGVTRFDEFQLYIGVATNILSTRLKKFVDLGVMERKGLPEHSRRYEYVLTDMGRDFFRTYLALKKWGDDWLTDGAGPQVVFQDRSGKEVVSPGVLDAHGKPLQLEDIEVVAGPDAVAFNRKRFGKGVPLGGGKIDAAGAAVTRTQSPSTRRKA